MINIFDKLTGKNKHLFHVQGTPTHNYTTNRDVYSVYTHARNVLWPNSLFQSFVLSRLNRPGQLFCQATLYEQFVSWSFQYLSDVAFGIPCTGCIMVHESLTNLDCAFHCSLATAVQAIWYACLIASNKPPTTGWNWSGNIPECKPLHHGIHVYWSAAGDNHHI